MSDLILFAVFPYLAAATAIIGGAVRYSRDRFSFTSLSSQFLEPRGLFWGSVPWHYGISAILLAHLGAALFPATWGRLLGDTGRLYALEISGIALGALTVCGLVILVVRRIAAPRVRAVTSLMDVVLLAALLVQVSLGVYIAIVYRWGSLWYVSNAAPWLASLARMNPQTDYVSVLPLEVRIHIVTACVLVALFPFTRLVHIVSIPLSYLWRPSQVVLWYRKTHTPGGIP